MTTLVIGSIAYDNIISYEGNLKDSINKETINGKINASIRGETSKREFGGTGLNICYNLALLDEQPILSGAIGNDYEFNDFIKENVNLDYIYKSELLESSSSFITKDNYGNSFSVFSPGAVNKADHLRISDITNSFDYAIISPTKTEAMFQFLTELKKSGVKTFFDPGQQLSTMTKENLEIITNNSDYLILNIHELELFKNIFELTETEIFSNFEKTIITLGDKGSYIYDKNGEKIEIKAVPNDNIIDNIGVGEAYRAGLIKGISTGKSWEQSAKIGSLMASFSLSTSGAQNHYIDKKQFEFLYEEEYGEKIEL